MGPESTPTPSTVALESTCTVGLVSHRAAAHALQYPGQWSSSARHVAAVVAAHVSDSDGTCWPSDTRLARLTGLGLRTVKRAVAELEAAGAIDRTTGPFVAGGRRRIITWRHWPDVGLLLVDNRATGTDPKGHTGPSEGPHRPFPEGPHRPLETVRNPS